MDVELVRIPVNEGQPLIGNGAQAGNLNGRAVQRISGNCLADMGDYIKTAGKIVLGIVTNTLAFCLFICLFIPVGFASSCGFELTNESLKDWIRDHRRYCAGLAALFLWPEEADRWNSMIFGAERPSQRQNRTNNSEPATAAAA